MCVCGGVIYINISSLCQRRGTASNDSLAALDTRGMQSLDFKHHPPEKNKKNSNNKKPGLLGEMADSKAGSGKTQKVLEYLAVQENKGMFCKRMETHASQGPGATSDQSWCHFPLHFNS